MLNKLYDFVFDHPILGSILLFVLFGLLLTLSATFVSCIFPDYSSTLENVKDAQYVLYTSDGEMKAVNAETIIDMDTGYQYRIFEINGQYVCAPAIDKDGTVYKTVE